MSLGHAVFGLVIWDGVVTDAAPIAAYAVGWTEKQAIAYFRRRGAVIDVLS